ncbi:MAG TPA: acyl carrier protein [Anaerolineaceae bacterium]|nr:acyl carrier protein [Anaerolineaceae bacterium]HPN52539.1 acyl carrier protein [Anaerolineaceae bacterium]
MKDNELNNLEGIIFELVKDLLQKLDKEVPSCLSLDSSLYRSGLGLDSLDTATLSAMLENKFGLDPYSQGIFPHTVREIVNFYKDR